MLAVGWMDKKLKTVLCSQGTTLPGVPSERQRSRVVIDPNGQPTTERTVMYVQRPAVIEELFKVFNAIDVHDLTRQGTLAMERNWGTKSPMTRLISTIEGIIYTDCYMAAKFDYARNSMNTQPYMGTVDFLDKLAYHLIFNPILLQENPQPPIGAAAQVRVLLVATISHLMCRMKIPYMSIFAF